MNDTNSELTACSPNQLWIPGMHLDEEHPTPSAEELAEHWQDYSQSAVVSPPSVYGALSEPSTNVTAVASIDICEVLRNTVQSFDKAVGAVPTSRSIYAKGTWLEKHIGTYTDVSVVTSIVRVLMNNGLVEPNSDVGEATEFMRSWRNQGVYVVANTSTLPGCETATIDSFKTAYGLTDCFDGLLLPRNHDGKGSLTKATALRTALADISIDVETIPVVHIDDSMHHIEGFENEFDSHYALGLYIPIHVDNESAPEHQLAESTAHAFELANRFYLNHGVIT